VREQQLLDNPWPALRERRAARHALPVVQPRVEDRRARQAADNCVIGMDTGIGGGENEPWLVLADELRDRDPQLGRIGDETILAIEKDSVSAEMCGGPAGLLRTHAGSGEVTRLAVAQVDQQHAQPLARQQRNRAAHLYLGVIGVRRDHHHVIGHGRASFCWSAVGHAD
jgi:hypothetical protein